MEGSGDQDITYARSPLETEVEAFNALLPELLETDYGRWALIHNAELLSIFDTEGDAIKVGYQTYGNVPFLTRQILLEQPHLFYNFGDAA